ncbi:NDP-sugar epimerase, includes UDP-GlcNAc-inverting 4,6-dehydratase FlaA1 and capsular polysaccharide biosynthesis protein EpsC [Pelagirhabdus alkalitolerans]|uniref:NDP-sugar epimerase, includes UDP-GlcNAc-inverting 4,6-dehydratase FlaA1 and capsular polysaccharide biosynthesis protein EpsC n=1 Tax=Pelagirhabdus alkalitolerans TaxID=1612202 RepID=A0A1G6GGN4_9BACI|nr:nucleoside-diphosphate sugar epimerase/dehydratase [Pelagirhabdus alkalitolerans]SDB81114.1 NDP-sugar epimerase, includes UDP-GlcNAc-inverting 4,6-dehydratase FlaA1 and capsular polysaccharide biosynthesis protein EpsC [Pelagirhabdus alkalitolerans]
MNYRNRMVSLVLLDSVIVMAAIVVASWVVYPVMGVWSNTTVLVSAIALLIFHHLYAVGFKLYHKVWSYASVNELKAIVYSVTLAVVSTGLIQFIINDFSVYRRALVVTWLLHVTFLGGSRFAWRMFRDRYINKGKDLKRTLIVGAGDAGAMIARQLTNGTSESDLHPVAFVDDDAFKQRMQIFDIPVLGTTQHIGAVVENKQIEHIIIAIPSLRNGQLTDIIARCNETEAKLQILPKIEDIATGKVSVKALRNVDVEDVLGREPVQLDIDAISKYVENNTVMVTGAGGSIGSEICRQLMQFKPSRILLVGHGEFSIYSIDMELRQVFADQETEIIPIIGDVQDRERIFDIVNQYNPCIIYHAAAHKHVPLMEHNPHEAIKNNVMGTRNVAEAADTFGTETFVLVSTDKAVNPANVMGATKRLAEMVVQDLAAKSSTKFVAVRFGNVLGSRGSVIPLFKKQIAKGGPVTVTHPDMTRYFMTIPEASRLVIQAGTLAKGGEIFVLDMGEPVKIVDLAKNLIKLSGYTTDDIPIEFAGIRPGEKMYEELLGDDEVLPGEVYSKIYVGRTKKVDAQSVFDLIEVHDDLTNETLKERLMSIVYHESDVTSNIS